MRLSIIVPVYNTEAYVAKCLDSLIEPDLGGYEIIAVNDGSTDSSGQVVRRYGERYPDLVKVVDTSNGGLSHARNVGIEASEADYLLFIDSDDFVSDRAVCEILQVLEQDMDIAVFDFVHVNESGEVTAAFDGSGRTEAFTLEEYPEFLFCPHNAVNKIWKRSLFTEHGIRFAEGLWYEDLATSPKLYPLAQRILPVHQAWYRYLQRQGSITNNRSTARNDEMITVAKLVIDWYRETGRYERYREQLCYKFFYEEYLAAVCRANLIDPKSPVQAALRDDFIRNFPDYRENPYVRKAPKKYQLLDRLIRTGNWKTVHAIMSLNKTVKGR
ncbi:MAG: glycosyltransferase [Oscillospiraceae bacterium]|nr:glycosyltransferase [Oscillospiraceae bacterium]